MTLFCHRPSSSTSTSSVFGVNPKAQDADEKQGRSTSQVTSLTSPTIREAFQQISAYKGTNDHNIIHNKINGLIK